jgi:hypothetical protein
MKLLLTKRHPHRRRWWQILTRTAIVIVLVIAMAYVTLPWWMPTSLLRSWIAHDLASQTGVEVTIEDLSVSWREGLVIRGLEIASPPGHGLEPMVSIKHIRTEFSPWRYLFAHRIEWMEVDQPSLRVSLDEDRNINIASLLKLSSPIEIGQITVENASGLLTLHGVDRTWRLDIPHTQFEAGHLQPIGQMIVTGLLEQRGQAAPIRLQVEGGRPDDPVASILDSTFTDIDLAQLPLLWLLPLPLDGLGGLCGGTLVLAVNRQGQIDQCRLSLTISDLLVQPLGEDPLPILPLAELHIDAAYDPLDNNGLLTIRSLTARLPGALELTGNGSAYAHALTGNWQGVQQLHLQGKASPAQLAALLGRSPQPGELAIDGSVLFSANMERSGPTTDFSVTADAVAATVRQDDRVLKPAQRRLSAELAMSVDERTWNAQINRCLLTLADNEFIGDGGSIKDVRSLLDRLEADSGRDRLLAELANIEWSGRWRLSDAAAIADAFPPLENALEDVVLSGGVTGAWAITHDGLSRMELLMDIPGQTELTVGELFAKPANQAVSLQIAADLTSDPFELSDMSLDFTSGTGRVRLDEIVIESTDDTLSATGQLEAADIQDFLQCLPTLDPQLRNAHGGFRGGFNASLSSEAAAFSADLRSIQLQADVHGPASVTGRMGISARTSRGGPARVVQLDIMADRLDWQWQADNGQAYTKPAGVPLRLALDAAGEEQRLNIDRLAVQAAESSVTLSKAVIVDDQLQTAQFDGAIVLSPALAGCVPQLDDLMQRWHLSGQAAFEGQFARQEEALTLITTVDGEGLSFTSPDGLTKTNSQPLTAELTVHQAKQDSPVIVDIRGGRFGPIQLAGTFDIAEAPRRSHGLITLKTTEADQLSALLPAMAPRPVGGGVGAEVSWQWTPKELDIAAEVTAANLQLDHDGHRMQLAGVGYLAAEYRQEADTLRVNQLTADGLRFDIGASHGWIVADIAGPTIPLAELRAESDGGEPASPPALAVTGTIHIVAEAIDVIELKEWFGSVDPTLPAMEAPDDGLPPFRVVTDARKAELLAAGKRTVRMARPTIMASDIRLDAQIDHLRTYNQVVDKVFDLYNVHAAASVDKGHVHIEYGGGLNSGTLRRTYTVDWSQDEPVMHYRNTIENARAEANIQAMLADQFPGNTVTGSLSHDEDVTVALAEMLALASEPFYPAHREGTGKTVAIEGWAAGQAAPEFITRIFPGLKMTKNEYEKMTAFSTFLPDGTAVNDTILNGPSYDTYMDGTTDAHHMGQYEIGVILLSTPQTPEWNHTYRQGRVPILNFEARIQHGRLYGTNVAYPWPTETLYTVFLKNNLVYRAWIEHEKDKDAPQPQQEP